ncbi:MAG: peptidoglycan-binding protein [Rhodobacteraceae bacterium]|nr:MAG: peptidoglycan-binding protein [Paracoccaceae bacterium]
MTQTPATRRAGAVCLTAVLAVLAACTHSPPEAPATRFAFTALEAARIPAPADAPAGTCWARDVTPAVVETQTAQVIVQPAILNSDGSLLAPAIYATETEQQIVEPRREYVFETLCAPEITPEFIASLQRALQARGRYGGAITGTITPETELAIRDFQRGQGLETRLLTMQTARQLGLAAVARS